MCEILYGIAYWLLKVKVPVDDEFRPVETPRKSECSSFSVGVGEIDCFLRGSKSANQHLCLMNVEVLSLPPLSRLRATHKVVIFCR